MIHFILQIAARRLIGLLLLPELLDLLLEIGLQHLDLLVLRLDREQQRVDLGLVRHLLLLKLLLQLVYFVVLLLYLLV